MEKWTPSSKPRERRRLGDEDEKEERPVLVVEPDVLTVFLEKLERLYAPPVVALIGVALMLVEHVQDLGAVDGLIVTAAAAATFAAVIAVLMWIARLAAEAFDDFAVTLFQFWSIAVMGAGLWERVYWMIAAGVVVLLVGWFMRRQDLIGMIVGIVALAASWVAVSYLVVPNLEPLLA